jgi:uncharacterized CHY-type Zn-finger protein
MRLYGCVSHKQLAWRLRSALDFACCAAEAKKRLYLCYRCHQMFSHYHAAGSFRAQTDMWTSEQTNSAPYLTGTGLESQALELKFMSTAWLPYCSA